MKTGRVVWITGLPGSGKSAVSRALRKRRARLVILQMDELRRLATPRPTYSVSERDILYRALVYAARTLSGLGHDVAIDATGNLRRWRELARAEIPGAFAEVYLKCPLSVTMEREKRRIMRRGAPRGVYAKAKKGWPVPGLAAPYEEPRHPELVIETDKTGVAAAAHLVDGLLRRLAKSRRG
ncbi:MAG: adenylyl-sulfate kinase [Nitrospiraceae bacterium]|nr:adenylyl-sulfate kinase [Nitrospiraceae bacterium]